MWKITKVTTVYSYLYSYMCNYSPKLQKLKIEMLDFLAMDPSKENQIITISLLWSSAQFVPIITPQYLSDIVFELQLSYSAFPTIPIFRFHPNIWGHHNPQHSRLPPSLPNRFAHFNQIRMHKAFSLLRHQRNEIGLKFKYQIASFISLWFIVKWQCGLMEEENFSKLIKWVKKVN